MGTSTISISAPNAILLEVVAALKGVGGVIDYAIGESQQHFVERRMMLGVAYRAEHANSIGVPASPIRVMLGSLSLHINPRIGEASLARVVFPASGPTSWSRAIPQKDRLTLQKLR